MGAASTTWLLVEVNSMIQDLARSYALERAQASKTRIALSLRRESSLALKLADSPTIKRWIRNEENPKLREQAFEELESYKEAFVDSNYFVVVDESRHYYNKSPGEDLVVTTLTRDEPDDKWYFATIAADKDASFNLDYDRSVKVSRVWINCLVRDQGKVIGMAGTGLEITELISRLISAEGRGITTMLTDKSGEILAHPDAAIMERNARADSDEEKVTVTDLAENQEDRGVLKDLLEKAQSGNPSVNAVNIEGEAHLTAMAPISEIDAIMVASVDTSSFVSLGDFTPLFILFILSLLVALVLIGFLMQRVVLRPLAVLTDSANQIAAGNYELSIPVQRSDEIGTLASAFNEMASKIQEYTTNLEELVAQRTDELTQANKQLAVTNQQMMESIRYARLIQEGVMASEESLASRLDYYSLFHRQRDIVGGDFLFFRTIPDADKQEGFLLGVVDCEGHGVSGALMTMMVDSHLHQICTDHRMDNPAGILQDLEEMISIALERSGGPASIKTGLDIGLCACFPAEKQIVFSGAGMPLYMRETDGTVRTVKGRRRSIKSAHRKKPEPFENQQFSSENRVFFMLTDGFVDQSGGDHGRAYGTKRLYSLLSSVGPTDIAPQSPAWERVFDTYRGEYQQRDDVLVIGFACPQEGEEINGKT